MPNWSLAVPLIVSAVSIRHVRLVSRTFDTRGIIVAWALAGLFLVSLWAAWGAGR